MTTYPNPHLTKIQPDTVPFVDVTKTTVEGTAADGPIPSSGPVAAIVPTPAEVVLANPEIITGIGSLQLRVLQVLWRNATLSTVEDVHEELNHQMRAANISPEVQTPTTARRRDGYWAYTTILTVMRNLARRGLLTQVRAAGARKHRFRPVIDEATYKRLTVQHLVATVFEGDLQAARPFLYTGM